MRLPRRVHNVLEDVTFPFRRAAANRRDARLERLTMAALDRVPDDDIAAQEAAIRAVYGMPAEHPESCTGELTHGEEDIVNAYEADLLSGAQVDEPSRDAPPRGAR